MDARPRIDSDPTVTALSLRTGTRILRPFAPGCRVRRPVSWRTAPARPAFGRDRLGFGGSSGAAAGLALEVGKVFTLTLSVALSLASVSTGCVFHPPPPLPEEIAAMQAEREAEEQAAASAEASAEAKLASFEAGDPAPPGMSPEDMQAYNRAQGDPVEGFFTLEQALAGLAPEAEGVAEEGGLRARLATSQGEIDCELFEAQTPLTVANFVGLARGLRPFHESQDPVDAAWKREPFYDGTQFHRVIPKFMVQGGDRSASGSGGPGYVIPDEIDPSIRFDRAGLLAMANRGLGTGGAQFFVTLSAVPHLNGRHTIFGQCTPASAVVAAEIAAVPRDANDRPETPVLLQKVTIYRGQAPTFNPSVDAPPPNSSPGSNPPAASGPQSEAGPRTEQNRASDAPANEPKPSARGQG